VLRGLILPRQWIRTGSGGDRSGDTEGYEDVPDRWEIPFSQRSPSLTARCRTHDFLQELMISPASARGQEQSNTQYNRLHLFF